VPSRAEGYARVPLLERLLDGRRHEQTESPPLRVLGEAGLRASIGAELDRLFNTRRATTRETGLTVLDYGIPDWSDRYVGNADDRLRIERGMLRAIQSFEPRLKRPSVSVTPIAGEKQTLHVDVRGQLQDDGEAPAVLFSIHLHNGRAIVRQA
jgi:type VI secretion system lysozyme-like protein